MADEPSVGIVRAVLWLCFGLSGVAALGFELLWMRSAGLVLGATATTTSTVLACYFTGLGLGAALGRRTSTGASQISGTIGAGENRTSTKTSRSSSMINALGTLSRAVTHPFAYSVTPQQTETLTISAAPALGAKALASPTPTPLRHSS